MKKDGFTIGFTLGVLLGIAIGRMLFAVNDTEPTKPSSIVAVKVVEQHREGDGCKIAVVCGFAVGSYNWALLENEQTHERKTVAGIFGNTGDSLSVNWGELKVNKIAPSY